MEAAGLWKAPPGRPPDLPTALGNPAPRSPARGIPTAPTAAAAAVYDRKEERRPRTLRPTSPTSGRRPPSSTLSLRRRFAPTSGRLRSEWVAGFVGMGRGGVRPSSVLDIMAPVNPARRGAALASPRPSGPEGRPLAPSGTPPVPHRESDSNRIAAPRPPRSPPTLRATLGHPPPSPFNPSLERTPGGHRAERLASSAGASLALGSSLLCRRPTLSSLYRCTPGGPHAERFAATPGASFAAGRRLLGRRPTLSSLYRWH